MHLFTPTTLLLLPFLTSAHFILNYPASRNGQDDEGEATSPCAGSPLSSNRTAVSLTSFPIALEMGHDESVIQILLSLSSDPTSEDDFNITLERTFSQTGLGDFCLPDVAVPASAGVKDGMNGTVQVVTDGEGGGGLYVCADVTFTSSSQPFPSQCKNNTGVTASPLPADNNINANESNAEGQPQSGTASGSASTASASASASSSSSAAMATGLMGQGVGMAGWGVMGGVVVGAVALL